MNEATIANEKPEAGEEDNGNEEVSGNFESEWIDHKCCLCITNIKKIKIKKLNKIKKLQIWVNRSQMLHLYYKY